MHSRPGRLIVGMGLPGCGKSSVFAALGRQYNVPVFCEPEEELWTDAVRQRAACGAFTAITWFRSDRVAKLFQADQHRQSGKTALMDSYYDKLIAHYIGKPGMEWLIHPSDPYYDLAVELARRDRELLPDADALVFFRVDFGLWRHFLGLRRRALDKDAAFLESFPTQDYFQDASTAYCDAQGVPLVVYEQKISNPDMAARALAKLLEERGLSLRQSSST